MKVELHGSSGFVEHPGHEIRAIGRALRQKGQTTSLHSASGIQIEKVSMLTLCGHVHGSHMECSTMPNTANKMHHRTTSPPRVGVFPKLTIQAMCQ